MKKIIPVILIAVISASCVSTRKVAYLQDIDERTEPIRLGDYETTINPDDNLHITVSSLDPEAVKIFNPVYSATVQNADALNINGYLVDGGGRINFPILGQVEVGGMTKSEAAEYLQKRISEYIKNPTVNIRFLNFKVTVLGEVNRPGSYTIHNERLTLLEAIGLAGDLTIYGKRDNVLIIREMDGVKTFNYLDLKSSGLMDSDFYYLHQNDIVYVQPNSARAATSTYNPTLSLGISLLTLITTIVALIL